MALDGRRGGPKPAPTRQSPAPTSAPPPGYDRERFPPPPARSGSTDRDRSRERYPPPPAAVERERSPLRADPYDDRFRDPYRDPPPTRDLYRRDDPYADPYRRPPPPDDPYYDRYRDDPYRFPPPPRRDPYADPYRDPYYRDPAYDAPPARKAPPPLDCQIVILNQSLMKFAEFVERKLTAVQVFCNISLIGEDRTIPQVVEDAAKKQCLFAIVINSQNEVHQSLTVNILHGTPQEHRNMPVDDAISLIGRSFDAYQLAKREKEAAARPAAAARAPPPFVPPSQDILYLLNLLADKRQLTVDELDKVINYLTDRRDKLLEAEGRLPPKAYPDTYGGAGEPKVDAQKDLQAKILSILNGPGDIGAGMSSKPQGNGSLDGRQGGGGMSSLINLDNPNVQKALDNLIQSGPNLLKTLSHAPGNPTQPGAAMMSRESQHTQPQASMGRDPVYGVPPPRGQGMQQMAGGRAPFGGVGGQVPRMANPGGIPPRRPPPQY